MAIPCFDVTVLDLRVRCAMGCSVEVALCRWGLGCYTRRACRWMLVEGVEARQRAVGLCGGSVVDEVVRS